MGGEDERARIAVGAEVVALNGETVGTIHTVRPHYLMVEGDDEDGPVDYEVPMHAVVGAEGGRIQLSVNLEALNEVRGEGQTAAHRLHEE
jgi:hypothetical protein